MSGGLLVQSLQTTWRRRSSSSALKLTCLFHILVLVCTTSTSVDASTPSTAPAEAEAFKTIFNKWGLTSQINWNSTEDPCSGEALGNYTGAFGMYFTSTVPSIQCDCSDNNGTTCHITALIVFQLDVAGEIPDELWNLTFLISLVLSYNYLTGSVSPSIGNLTKMQYLSIENNALSGKLPAELGQLTKLKALAFGTNNFSGHLPSQMGNGKELQSIYMSSAGVSGEIPASFANLVNLKILDASDNELNGSIPEFIGAWTQISTLKLEGNSFVGSIPSSFSNLTSLEDLRIGDLPNGKSSLAFITNLTSLNVLRLRNISFLDSNIPSGIGKLKNLTYLDLSFNNINGSIPDALFSLGSLFYLYLGNNTLTGSLPQNTTSSLSNIDISYNQLSGTLPSWVYNQNLQLNLVANNFTNTSGRELPLGLNCLQSNFPCFRGSQRYSSFAINCGGPKIISSSGGTVYEQENNTLGPATYYVEKDNRWAISNAGYPVLNPNASSNVASSSLPISNTADQEIFQTTRLSAGSLRYYGLGLENGNYTVLLQFAELVIMNGKTWKSLGRRVFDIYIQGHLEVKNFDIRNEAGGKSFCLVEKKFVAQVTKNYLEIHLLWAGKGTCCVPERGIYGPSISAISVTPVGNESQPLFTHRLLLEVALPVGCVCLLFAIGCYTMRTNTRLLEAQDEGATAGFATVILVFNCYWMYRMLKRRKEIRRRAKNFARNGGLLLQEMASSSGDRVVEKTKIFTARELEKATDSFNNSRIVGKGGHGTVYKGMLVDGRIVAIKKSNIVDEDQSQQFINEVVILSQINHRNVVKLLGCCLETDIPLLVYEFVPNDTLYHILHCPNEDFHLTWKMRLQIAAESAGALAYLHSSSSVPVYHRDIKSSNILLDEKYRAKVSDFGISRTISVDEQTHLTTIVQGTHGYLDPEYFRSLQFNDKSDVYSFGVVLVELITGKKALLTTDAGGKKNLATEFLQVMESSRFFDILDDRIVEEAKEEEVLAVANLATRCLNMNGKNRPTMKELGMVLEIIRSFQVLSPVEEICLEVNHATHEVSKTKCCFCSDSCLCQEASSSFSIEVLPLISNYT